MLYTAKTVDEAFDFWVNGHSCFIDKFSQEEKDELNHRIREAIVNSTRRTAAGEFIPDN